MPHQIIIMLTLFSIFCFIHLFFKLEKGCNVYEENDFVFLRFYLFI